MVTMVIAVAKFKPIGVAKPKGAEIIKVIVPKVIVIVKVIVVLALLLFFRVVVALVPRMMLGIESLITPPWREPEPHKGSGRAFVFSILFHVSLFLSQLFLFAMNLADLS